jgi:hypothetical protein
MEGVKGEKRQKKDRKNLCRYCAIFNDGGFGKTKHLSTGGGVSPGSEFVTMCVRYAATVQ